MRGDFNSAAVAVGALLAMSGVFTATKANAQDFTFSSEAGAIVRLERSPDLSLKGMICAPSATGSCSEYNVRGVNKPGTFTLEIEGKDDRTSSVVDYARVRQPLQEVMEGYTVWEATSPNAPEYLKSFRAPVTKTDPISNQYLREWNGAESKLLDFSSFVRAEVAIDSYYRKKGYPIDNSSTVPLVVSRQDAASWEALTMRESGVKPDITNFSSGFEQAVVATDRQTVLASLRRHDDLGNYVALSNEGRTRPSVIELSKLRIKAPVKSIFDEYVDPNQRNQALASLNAVFGASSALGSCYAVQTTFEEFVVECVKHTNDYQIRASKIFVSSSFFFFIGAIEQNIRRINVVQRSVGAEGPKDKDPPAPVAYKIGPEANENVMYVDRQLRSELRRLISEKYPRIEVE